MGDPSAFVEFEASMGFLNYDPSWVWVLAAITCTHLFMTNLHIC